MKASCCALALAVVAAVLAFAMPVATQQGGVDEEIYGTWTRVAGDYARIVVTSDKAECYVSSDDSKPQEEDQLVIESKWVESDGSIFFKIRGTVTAGSFKGVKFQELGKISDSRKKWEYMQVQVFSFGPGLYPKEINPKSTGLYRCYLLAGN